MTPKIALAGGPIDDEEAAAAIAAVLAVLEAEAAAAADEPAASPRGWHASARLMVQGFLPARLPTAPTWGHVERLRRAGRGGSGIVGQ
jgi:hypothetical protein